MSDRPGVVEHAGPGLVDQSKKIAFLCQPASYPEGTVSIDAKETHMSWVFLTEKNAYKLKKPVHHDFIDFSTVSLRRRFCEEELRLNRRLAPDVYLAVVPLTITPRGTLQLGGSGIPVDWLVKMRRLSESRTLDSTIRSGSLSSSDLDALVGVLTDFYKSAPRTAISREEYRRQMSERVESNRAELLRYCPPSTKPLIQRVSDAQAHYIAAEAEAFDRRVEEGHIVEGHGDLRPEHVFLGAPPQIIDCLEFNMNFRTLDIADDLALLAMECDQLGAPGVGDALFHIPGASSAPQALRAFYQSYRAALRAKLAIWHLKDRHLANPSAWEDRAVKYLFLAEHERNGRF